MFQQNVYKTPATDRVKNLSTLTRLKSFSPRLREVDQRKLWNFRNFRFFRTLRLRIFEVLKITRSRDGDKKF